MAYYAKIEIYFFRIGKSYYYTNVIICRNILAVQFYATNIDIFGLCKITKDEREIL